MSAPVFKTTAELAVPTETLTNEANEEIEKDPLTAENKIKSCLKLFKALQTLLYFLLIKSWHFFYSKRLFLVSSIFWV